MSTEELLTNHDSVAIVGIAGRFPGARTLDEFWQNLCQGVESISFFTEEELLASGVERDLIHDPRYVKARAILDDIESFDAAFFGYSPKEAAMIDPQQRLFLECAWEALEQAGYSCDGLADTTRGLIGVYAGQGASSYLLSNLLPNRSCLAETGILPIMVNNDKDFLATRVSYKLNLEGPGITIQTACSTSLVAVHMACQGLLGYECNVALAGGASIFVPQKTGYLYGEESFLSPDGHCRAFDAEACGTVSGNGVGVVALKRLSDALADGDTIYAVIRGSAINNDGAAKVGYAAPSVQGQAKAIVQALAIAGTEPDTISYVETHGTGTTLGDPIEIAALTQAFRSVGTRTGASPVPTAIGSIKTNLGHLDAAAGIAGLIKTVLALKHGMLPPSLNFHHPNPKIDFANSPFYVNTHLKPWKRGSTPRRAGVSSFGIGGTNVHVILEEAPPVPPSPRRDSALSPLGDPSEGPHLVVLSAKTAIALETMTDRLATYVKAHPDVPLADVAYTLQMGRKSFPHRRAFVAHDRTDIPGLFPTRDPQEAFESSQYSGVVSGETMQVAFLFPGQGAQYVNMGRELYEEEPTFRDQIDTCARLLLPHLQRDLREVIYPTTNNQEDESIHQTSMTQPALFAIEYALAQLLLKWGIHPQAMIGHSIGEYVAACLAGVFSLEDALALVALRGRLIQALPAGAMLSVRLPERDLEEFLEESGGRLALAACNGPNNNVISGTLAAIELLEKQLMEKGISYRRLQTSHAFHSHMMDPILEQFTSYISRIALHPPKIPYISNITGTWITDHEATNPHYWAQHIRQTVRFAEGIQLLLDTPSMVLLEVGPGHTLSTLARQTVGTRTGAVGIVPCADPVPTAPVRVPTILSTLRHPQNQISDRVFLLNTCGQLWCAGVSIDWSQLYAGSQRRRIPLPTYPFERQRYWISPGGTEQADFRKADPLLLSPMPVQFPMAPDQGHQEQPLRKEPDLAQWFSIPSWKRSPLLAAPIPSKQSEQKDCWLIFADTVGLSTRLGEKLPGTVIIVRVGTQFHRSHRASLDGRAGLDSWEYTIRPDSREDYDSLLNDIGSYGLFPTRIIHLWTVIATDHIPSGLDYFETAQALGFYSLLFLTQALGEQKGEQFQEVTIITNNLQEVIGREVLCPVRATALGVGKIAPYEYPHISFRSIDIVLPVDIGQTSTDEEQLVEQIIGELRSHSSDREVAYRGPHRWIRCIEPLRLEAITEEQQPLGLRQQGAYLITGGLGGIGLKLAEDMARSVQAKLVLLGRTALPARAEWDHLWDKPTGYTSNEQDAVAYKIRQIKRLEELGSEVLVIQADVTDLEQMQAVIRQVGQHFGDLHGVIHAAGLPSGGLIQLKTPEVAARILAPKVKGALVLEAVLKDLHLDFIVLCSSLATSLSDLGQVDYCAANTFLDSFAYYHAAKQRVRTISIDWDIWQEVGMGVNAPKEALPHSMELKNRLQNGMLPQEGVEVFRRIIAHDTPTQVMLSTSNIQTRLRRAESFLLSEQLLVSSSGEQEPRTGSAQGKVSVSGTISTILHPRPNLPTAYVAPQNETQQQIADLWQEVLGIEKIGIHDNFFTLGGDSILGIQIMARARPLGLQITPRQIFQHQTIAELATVSVGEQTDSPPQSRRGGDKPRPELPPLAHVTPTQLDYLKAVHPQMEDLYPLTPLQQGILFHTLYEPDSGVYVCQIVYTFCDLNQQNLADACRQVVAQHAILRTAFAWRNLEEPHQLVESRVDLPITTLDWRDRSAEQQEHNLSSFLQEDRMRGFDLEQAPLIRLTFICLSEAQTLVVWSHHQILIDGWSLGLMLHDVFTCYLARMQNETPQLPPRPLYRDYLAWLSEQSARNDGEEEAYWRSYLAGFRSPTPLLKVPVSGIDQNPGRNQEPIPHAPQTEKRYGTEMLSIKASTHASIQEAARRYQVTLNTLTLGAWALVLSLYSGEQDVVFGTVVSGRPAQLEGVESMIGLFINTLPVRVQVRADERVQDWLIQLQQQQVEHRRYEQSALVQVQSWSEIPSKQSVGQAHRPLFESLFNFLNASLEAGLHEAGRYLNVERVTMHRQANYPLTIFVIDQDELCLRIDYDSQRFEATAIQRLLFHLRTVLEQLASQPDLPLADISFPKGMASPTGVVTSTPAIFAVSSGAPQEGIHTLFEAQAEKTPDALAVVYYGSEMLTYGELNRRANQLACYLRARGIGPEVRVGVLLERSLWLPIVLLGILKAGGAYVPLDPAWPPARLTLLAQDAELTMLVTSEQQNKHLGIGDVLLLEQLWQRIKECDDRNPDILKVPVSGISDNHLAYIVYTSGSTGRPKGVLSTHAGVVNYLRFVTQTYQLTADIVVLQLPPLSFDASVRDIFATLIVGGRLVLVKEQETRDFRALITCLQQQKVTALLSTVPSFLHTLLDTADSIHEMCPSVQLVLVSGEPLSLELVGHARRVFGADLRVINQYGPTEATMTSTYYEVDTALGEKSFALIGKPLTNMQAYVLDQHLRLVPVGTIGEVYLAGPGLARGYLAQPDTTAEKFIPNPFVTTPFQSGTRMYRTGDLARYLPDGILEYHGRRDQQIKIRGNRVELAEIRVALEEYPGVSQAIVVAQEMEQTTDVQLVAYIMPKPGQTPGGSELRPFLQERLPEYMLPTHFITLETIPLTPNGKLDRRALPLPQAIISQVEAITESEMTPLQAQVAAIWADMLHQPHVSVHDDFFELGGHSLLALQLLNRIRTTFAVDLPLDALFETPTVEQMAHDIEELINEASSPVGTGPAPVQAAGESLSLHPMERPSDTTNGYLLPLSFAQERLWFLDQWNPGSAWCNVPMALRLSGLLQVSALEHSLATVVQRHEVLRTTFDEHAGRPVQVIRHSDLPIQIAVIDLRDLTASERDQQVTQLARTETQRPFDLISGPLLRVRLIRIGTREHVLLFTLHHIVTDGWSMEILAREMTTLYLAEINSAREEPIKLPDLPIQYADYALWQRQWLQGEVLDTHIAYWKRQLAGAPAQLKLPTDRPRPTVPSSDGASLNLHISAELTDKLRALSQREGVTLFMLLLAAFQILLSRYTGQDDIVVGTNVANRNWPGVEELIGFFVNQLALRTNLSGNPTFLEVLQRVKQMTLGAYTHQDLPFEKLVGVLNPKRSVEYAPLFQVKLNFQPGARREESDPSGVGIPLEFQISPLQLEVTQTKLDLEILLNEGNADIVGKIVYSTILFEISTITCLSRHFEVLLETVVKNPATKIRAIELLTKEEKEQKRMEANRPTAASLSTWKEFKPKRVSQKNLIVTSTFQPDQRLPLIVQPSSQGLNLLEWVKHNVGFIETELLKHGGLLFRGFAVHSPGEFEQFARGITPHLFHENGEHPREAVSENVYTPVFYPPEKKLLWHNENSFNASWPTKIWFYCGKPAEQGGETPLVDNRRVFQQLDAHIRERFMQKDILYVRNYGDGLGLSWQTVFGTTSKAAVENACRKAAIEFEWKDGDHLRTRQLRPAVLKHPQTGEWVWWNQATHWHIACLEPGVRDSLLALYREEDLPRSCYYGDGSPIEDAVMEAICQVYQQAEISFPWQQGDILMLDNMLTAHARNAYQGERKLYVVMGDMLSLHDMDL